MPLVCYRVLTLCELGQSLGQGLVGSRWPGPAAAMHPGARLTCPTHFPLPPWLCAARREPAEQWQLLGRCRPADGAGQRPLVCDCAR